MSYPMITMVMVPEEQWTQVKNALHEIQNSISKNAVKEPASIALKYITAMEFMQAVRIKRTKFDKLVQTSKIKIVKKGRKIYVPVGEVERFFSDRNIQ
jgi:hypothetical protein